MDFTVFEHYFCIKIFVYFLVRKIEYDIYTSKLVKQQIYLKSILVL